MELASVPLEEDCCGSGCNPCIFDIYESQLDKYRSKKYTEMEIKNLITLTSYTKFVLTHSENCSDCCKLLKFSYISDENEDQKVLSWYPGQHFLLKYHQQDGSKCTRAYSPLRISKYDKQNDEFCIIVKKYDGGNCSNYLHELPLNSETYWRGPYGNYRYSTKNNRQFFIAQGVGLTTFYSIIEFVLADDNNESKLTLYYCINKLSDIILRDFLKKWSEYWNFSYYIFAKRIDDTIKYKEPVLNKRFSVVNMLECIGLVKSNDEFLICGSNRFIECIRSDLLKANVSADCIKSFE